MTSTVLKMGQLVDLAVGSPEPGSVNFNILHSLLHVIIQQLQLEETRVEFRGVDADRMYTIVQSTPSEPVLELSEYVVYVDNEDKIIDNKEKADVGKEEKKKLKSDSDPNARAVVVVQRKESKEKTKKPAPPTKPQRTVYAKTPANQSMALEAISHKIARIEQSVNEMRDYQVPTNDELIQSVRSGKDESPVGGMWEKMKLAARMDAAEAAMLKLTSMVEEVAREANIPVKAPSQKGSRQSVVHEVAGTKSPVREPSDPKAVTSAPRTATSDAAANRDRDILVQTKRVNSLERRMWDVENKLLSVDREGGPVAVGSFHEFVEEPGAEGAEAYTDVPVEGGAEEAAPPEEGGVTEEGGPPEEGKSDGGSEGGAEGAEGEKKKHRPRPSVNHGAAIAPIREELVRLKKDLDGFVQAARPLLRMAIEVSPDEIVNAFKDIEELKTRVATLSGDGESKPVWKDDQEKLESQLNESKEAIAAVDNAVANQVESLHNQMADMEKDVGMLIERVNSGLPSDEGSNQGFGGFGELYGKIQAMQYDMDVLTTANAKLQEDKAEQDMLFKALTEQVEVLKTIKADKEDVEDALDDKADKNHMARKVSNDQFDAACEDLSKGLDEALTKLTDQENLWSLALEDIQKEIEGKLDKVEISPLKDFVNAKLKMLQQRIKTLAALRNETEAAGTKRKLLKDVNCLSCDKSVVQRVDDEGNTIQSEALPGTRSMRPYLTYELDAVRKQQKRLPGARNLNHFEDAVNEQAQAKRKGGAAGAAAAAAAAADHLCNRYCGGSHTITTPQQRVTRMGHFINQFGPQAIPLSRPPTRGEFKETQTSLTGVETLRPPSAADVAKRSGSGLKTGSLLKTGSPTKGSLEKAAASSKQVVADSKTVIASKSTSLSRADHRSGSKASGSQGKVLAEEGSKAKLKTPTGSLKGSLVGTPTGSPKESPKGSQQGSPKTGSQGGSPKAAGSPTGSGTKSPKGSPKGTPTGSPKGSPKASQEKVASPQEGDVVPVEGEEAPVDAEAPVDGGEGGDQAEEVAAPVEEAEPAAEPAPEPVAEEAPAEEEPAAVVEDAPAEPAAIAEEPEPPAEE